MRAAERPETQRCVRPTEPNADGEPDFQAEQPPTRIPKKRKPLPKPTNNHRSSTSFYCLYGRTQAFERAIIEKSVTEETSQRHAADRKPPAPGQLRRCAEKLGEAPKRI